MLIRFIRRLYMKLIKNLNIRKKLLCISVPAWIFIMLIAGMSYFFLTSANARLDALYSNQLLPNILTSEIGEINNTIKTDLFELMITRNMDENNRLNKDIQTHSVELEEKLKIYQKGVLNETESALVNAILKDFEQNKKVIQSVIKLAMVNQNKEAFEMYVKDMKNIQTTIDQDIQNLFQYNLKTSESIHAENANQMKTAIQLLLIVTIMAIVFSGVTSSILTKWIVNPLREMANYMSQLSKGDLTQEAYNQSHRTPLNRDEIGQLGNAIIHMRQNLWELISQVATNSEEIAISSEALTQKSHLSSEGIEEIANAVATIAENAENQMQGVSSTNEHMQSISEIITTTSESTTQTSKMTHETLKATSLGEKAIEDTIAQMKQIEVTVEDIDVVVKTLEKRSNEIGQIVGVISEIADQTNLLALNAAIEAARAGEQGRGFSVVAEEVRKLAEVSMASAKNIEKLIKSNQTDTQQAVKFMNMGTDQVKIGMSVVQKAGTAFMEISNQVQMISNKIQQVTEDTALISERSQEIAKDISGMDENTVEVARQTQNISASTQEQSATMQDMAQSAGQLSKIAEGLQVEIGRFRL